MPEAKKCVSVNPDVGVNGSGYNPEMRHWMLSDVIIMTNQPTFHYA